MTIDEAIKHAEEVAEEQERNAHVHKNMMVFRQNIKHNILAKLHEESMNECIKCVEEHRQLAKWLNELKALREQTRWIPVTERLPNIGERVMVTFQHEFEKDTVEITTYSKRGFYVQPVVAWMPLPETYKAESEANADGDSC